MGIKKQLCDIIKDLKRTEDFTYDHLHEITGIHRSQLHSVLKREGDKVSIENIHHIIKALGYDIEVHLRKPFGTSKIMKDL